jgi:hypothetical protein
MPKPETLDEKIAKALIAEASAVAFLDGLIDDAEKAMVTTKEAAAVARARAVDPRVVDSSALAIAIENESLQKRYANAREQLIKKRNAIELAAAHATWTKEADQVETTRNEVAEEFASTYASILSTFLALAERVRATDQAVNNVNATALNGNRRVEGLDVAVAVIAGVKLPNPEHTQQFIWPAPAPVFMPGLITPAMYSRRYSADWAAAQQEEAEAILKQKREEAQQREAEAQAAFPNTPRWWAGETFGPEKLR